MLGWLSKEVTMYKYSCFWNGTSCVMWFMNKLVIYDLSYVFILI